MKSSAQIACVALHASPEDMHLGSCVFFKNLPKDFQWLPEYQYRFFEKEKDDGQSEPHPGRAITAAEAFFASLLRTLFTFTPRIEPCEFWPGVFWLDASGLLHLFKSHDHWGRAIQAALQKLECKASVVMGSRRLLLLALAYETPRMLYMPSPEEEEAKAQHLPLRNFWQPTAAGQALGQPLGFSKKLCRDLEKLEIRNVGALLRIPQKELRLRYGVHAERLGRWAQNPQPLQAFTFQEPLSCEIDFEPPEKDHHRMVFRLKSALHPLLNTLALRSQAVSMITMFLRLESHGYLKAQIEMAKPSLHESQILELIRLRLSALSFDSAVLSLGMHLESLGVTAEQVALWMEKKRDLEALARAYARLRALFGSQAVQCPQLVGGILPEARFRWRAYGKPSLPEVLAEPKTEPAMVRLILPKPISLGASPERALERGFGDFGEILKMHGPYRIHGGWWLRRVHRDYYFVQTQSGALLWLYFDALRNRWLMQGLVD